MRGYDAASYWSRFLHHFSPLTSLRPEAEPVQLLRKLHTDAASNRLRDKYEVSLRLYEWLLSMLRQTEGGAAQGADMPDGVVQAKHWMEARFREPFGLEQAAAVAGMSKHHFCKMFHRYTGSTPMHYVRHLRLEEAAQLLRHTKLPVTAIAEQTGFDNISYFGKVFRQAVGLSPSDYREGKKEAPFGALRMIT